MSKVSHRQLASVAQLDSTVLYIHFVILCKNGPKNDIAKQKCINYVEE